MFARFNSRDDPDPPPEKRTGPAGVVRRAFGHGESAEEHLEGLIHERRDELEEYRAKIEDTARTLAEREERLRDERLSVERLLRRSTAELEARELELVQFERGLNERNERLTAAETDVARRRSELGAVELKRAALEQRERTLDAREEAIAARESEPSPARPASPSDAADVQLLFVPGAAYRLVESDPRVLAAGMQLELEDESYVVTRVGRSPFPGDRRRCAYLAREAPWPSDGGSL